MQQPPYPPRPPYPLRPPYSSYPSSVARRPQPPPSYQRAWRWYRRTPGIVQVGIACLVLALLLCPCASFAAASMATSSLFAPTVVQTPAPAQGVAVQDTAVPTVVPTPIVTLTLAPTSTSEPTPTPTPSPLPTLTPTPQPTQLAAAPTPTPCPGVGCNPWGYNFVPGNLIYSPPDAFCNFFTCIQNFRTAHGYVVECRDAEYGKLGGTRGACSSHGGVWRTLYAH